MQKNGRLAKVPGVFSLRKTTLLFFGRLSAPKRQGKVRNMRALRARDHIYMFFRNRICAGARVRACAGLPAPPWAQKRLYFHGATSATSRKRRERRKTGILKRRRFGAAKTHHSQKKAFKTTCQARRAKRKTACAAKRGICFKKWVCKWGCST